MNTAVVNIKMEASLKREAAKTAHELGLSLSAVIKGFLKQFVARKSVTFERAEIPSDYMIRELKKAEEDVKAGRVVSFKTSEDALRYLDDMIEKETHARK